MGAAWENTPSTVWEGYMEEPSLFGVGGKPRREGRTMTGRREHRSPVTGLDPATLIASGSDEQVL